MNPSLALSLLAQFARGRIGEVAGSGAGDERTYQGVEGVIAALEKITILPQVEAAVQSRRRATLAQRSCRRSVRATAPSKTVRAAMPAAPSFARRLSGSAVAAT